MQWDGGPGAGFTTGEPWLPLAADAASVTVAAQRDYPASMLTLHRRPLALRRRTPALTGIGYQAVEAAGDVLAYLRVDEDSGRLVALNLGHADAEVTAPGAGRIELSTVAGRDGKAVTGTIRLRPDEGLLVRLADG